MSTSIEHEKKSEQKSEKKSVWWKAARAKKVFGICAAIFALGFLIWWFKYRPYVSTEDARVAMTLVKLAPEGVGGTAEKVNVSEGDRVTKGAILVELDHRVPEAQVQRAKSRAKLAAHELARIEELAKQNGVPARDLDKAQAEFQAADAELKLAETNLANTFLKSPVNGIVVQKIADVGNIIEPGQVSVVIADVDNAWIAANIEETYVGEISPGQLVDISIDEGGKLLGNVQEIRRAAASQFALIPTENTAGNFVKQVQRIPIKIKLAGPTEKPLRAGQSVIVRIHVK